MAKQNSLIMTPLNSNDVQAYENELDNCLAYQTENGLQLMDDVLWADLMTRFLKTFQN